MTTAPTIDAEFHDLIPPLTADERRHLEESIARDGCRDPIVTWNGVVVDGHNRLSICQAKGVDFKTVERSFDGRDSAVEWIIHNQLGRRNVSDYVRTSLALRLKPIEEARAKERQKTSTGGTKPQLVANLPQAAPGKTREVIAKVAGVSPRTVAKVEEIEKKAAPEVKQAAREGKTSIDAAYKTVKPPKAEKPDTKVAGKSKVNGVEADDPPDVAKLRAAGKIPEGVVVEVSEPEPIEEPAVEEAAELSDAEWLETLPLHGQLGPGLVEKFDADALDYRRLHAARKSFAYHAARSLKSRNGSYAYLTRRYLKTDHPKSWLLCPPVEHEGCGGTGQIQFVGQCPKCFGRGYWVR